MSDMKTVVFNGKRGPKLLHIEAPGCVVNIHVGLNDTMEHEITRVTVNADDGWKLPDMVAEYRDGIGIRVRKESL